MAIAIESNENQQDRQIIISSIDDNKPIKQRADATSIIGFINKNH